MDVSVVTIGRYVIYSIYPCKAEMKARLPKTIDKIYEEINNGKSLETHKRYIGLSVSGSDPDGAELNTPNVKYKIKH